MGFLDQKGFATTEGQALDVASSAFHSTDFSSAVSGSVFSKPSRPLQCVDGLAVAYLVGSAVLLVPGCWSGWVYVFFIGFHVAIAVSVLLLARARSLPPVLQVVRETYPLLLLLLLYGEIDLIVQLVHEPPVFDALVQQWDLWLFGNHPHLHLHRWLSGQGWKELFHFLYLSYYLLLIGAFLGVWWTRSSSFPRFSFVVTGMFVSFMALFVAFPVAGPISAPGVSFMTDGVFPRIVAQIYAPLAVDGIHAGAFPSSHVGMSVGIVLLLAPRRWWTRIALGTLVLGIALSTTYGRFHYAIDAVAGLLAGGVLYFVWNGLYTALQPQPSSVTERKPTDDRVEPAPASPALSRRDR